MNQNNRPKPDVYQMVTDRIIAALQKGVIPWRQPWRNVGPPRNLITGRHYRGINFWLLLSLGYPQNFFLSGKQVKDHGGRIKEGEKPHIVVYWKMVTIDNKDTTEKKEYPFLRYYLVYNVNQCEGLQNSTVEVTNVDLLPIVPCEEIISGMPNKPVIRHKGDKAYYNPLKDFINMPPVALFENSEAYYSVLFHELIHSTGHSNRLGRKELLEMGEFGSEMYSVEELTAEIGSCFLKSIANIENDTLEASAAYIEGWLKKLKGDNRLIVYASSQAQKATDFVLGTNNVQQDEQGEEKISEDKKLV